jgi:hypothetical protein
MKEVQEVIKYPKSALSSSSPFHSFFYNSKVIFGDSPLCPGREPFVRVLAFKQGEDLCYQFVRSTIGYFELTIAKQPESQKR